MRGLYRPEVLGCCGLGIPLWESLGRDGWTWECWEVLFLMGKVWRFGWVWGFRLGERVFEKV